MGCGAEGRFDGEEFSSFVMWEIDGKPTMRAAARVSRSALGTRPTRDTIAEQGDDYATTLGVLFPATQQQDKFHTFKPSMKEKGQIAHVEAVRIKETIALAVACVTH